MTEKPVELSEQVAERTESDSFIWSADYEAKQVLAALPSIIIGVDLNHRIDYWNDAAEQLFEIPRAQVLHLPLDECSLPFELAKVKEGVERCRQSKERSRIDDVPFGKADGKQRFLGFTALPIFDEAAELKSVVLFGADITERKFLHSQLASAQKLEAIGQLASGVAHEINTPLQYLSDNATFLNRAFGKFAPVIEKCAQLVRAAEQDPDDPSAVAQLEPMLKKLKVEYLLREVPLAIQQTLDGIGRVSEVVRALKEFAVPQSDSRKHVDLNTCIENAVIVARSQWKEVAQVELKLDPELPPVPCLAAEINQVLLHLIINAVQAIEDAVSAGNPSPGVIVISTSDDITHVEIRVSDTGLGIDEAVREKVFDLFFSTKEVGRGSGQGLSFSHNVVTKQHGGKLFFESEKGQGSTFIVRLPK